MLFIFWKRDRALVREGQRERKTEFEAGSRLWVVSIEPDSGLKLTSCEIMTWAKVRCLTNWVTHVPLEISRIGMQGNIPHSRLDGFQRQFLFWTKKWAPTSVGNQRRFDRSENRKVQTGDLCKWTDIHWCSNWMTSRILLTLTHVR